MKKSLIALAAVAASGAAFAQSSVTVFGVVDAAVTVYDGEETVSGLGNSGNSSSRLGFRGVEDLGNGLKAQFWLEGAISNDDGSGVGAGAGQGFEFKRRSTVSLLSNYGELRLGRSTTAAYDAVSRYDNFGTVGVGASRVWSTGGYDNRKSNMVSYYSPDFSGFKFAANYAFGEQDQSTWKRGAYYGLSATYDNGPLSVGFGAERQNNANPVLGSNTNRLTAYGIGGSYNFGVVKLAAAYLNQESQPHPASVASADYDNFLLAVSAPVGAAGEVKASYNRYEVDGAAEGKADQFSLGYVHNLSKRTAVYGTYSYLKNKNGGNNFTLGGAGVTKPALDDGKIQAVQVGVRHAF